MAAALGEARQHSALGLTDICERPMVNPLEILPVLLLCMVIVMLPLLSDGPPGG